MIRLLYESSVCHVSVSLRAFDLIQGNILTYLLTVKVIRVWVEFFKSWGYGWARGSEFKSLRSKLVLSFQT